METIKKTIKHYTIFIITFTYFYLPCYSQEKIIEHTPLIVDTVDLQREYFDIQFETALIDIDEFYYMLSESPIRERIHIVGTDTLQKYNVKSVAFEETVKTFLKNEQTYTYYDSSAVFLLEIDFFEKNKTTFTFLSGNRTTDSVFLHHIHNINPSLKKFCITCLGHNFVVFVKGKKNPSNDKRLSKLATSIYCETNQKLIVYFYCNLLSDSNILDDSFMPTRHIFSYKHKISNFEEIKYFPLHDSRKIEEEDLYFYQQ